MKRSSLKKTQKPLNRSPLKKQSIKTKNKQEDKEELRELDNIFYEKLWNTRIHYCQLSCIYLGETPSKMFFHHLLPKNQYPQYRHKDWNILICHPSVHSQIETNENLLEENQFDTYNELLNKAKKEAGIL